ncbi:MAG: penicillin-binding protein 2 [Actinobacteria bacterium]|nr:penicillin-binding protein 2 [Actinomycetota bacterium]
MKKTQVKDKRLLGMVIILVLGLILVSAKLMSIQILKADYYKEKASNQRERVLKITQNRGTLFDREGEVLAISEDVRTVYATPYLIEEKAKTANTIAEILGEDPVDVLEKLEEDSGFVYLARKLDNERADKIEKLNIEGVGFLDESKRYYPAGEMASQVLGIVDVDNQGQAGIEIFYEDILGGSPGEIVLERDAVGNPIPGSEVMRKQAEDGIDLQLTIDKDVQAHVQETMNNAVETYHAKAGTAIVIDCNTGDIIAMATSPSFDPEDREAISPETMRNRAVTDIYEPGSVLKIITASAALEEGVVTPGTVMSVPPQIQVADQVFKEATPQGTRQLSFAQIISQSSNVGTIQTALNLGKERHAKYLKKFGVGQLTGIDFPGEVQGLVPDIADYSGTSVATISIGQGISITPVQLVCAVCVIANGGRTVQPHLLEAKVTDGGIENMELGGMGEQVLRDETCVQMTAIMEQVTAPGGTGTRAALPYYRVAGKTGTAAKPLTNGAGYSKGYMATFVGFAPAENPQLAAVVILDEPSPIWGGHTSAPVFKEIMGYSLQHMDVPPSWGTPDAAGGDASE